MSRTSNGQLGSLSSTFHSSQSLRTMTSSILSAGASCVLLSLWPVPLSALQILYRVFYSSLLQGTRVSTALNEAIATIQNTSQFSHPTNWAAFLLIGSDIRLSSQVCYHLTTFDVNLINIQFIETLFWILTQRSH
jgi:hypothetical protein